MQGKHIEAAAECLRVISFFSTEQPTIDQGRLLEVANLELQKIVSQASLLLLLLLGCGLCFERERDGEREKERDCVSLLLYSTLRENKCFNGKANTPAASETRVHNSICILSSKGAF